MTRLRQLVVWGAVVALGGCAVGPSYQRPVVSESAKGPWMSGGSVAVKTAPPDKWWALYQDAQLERFIQEAFTANTDLKVAEANLSAARALLEAARAGRYPQTAVAVGAIRGRDALTDEILQITGHPPRTIWKFNALIDVSYEADLFGRIRRSVEAARADHEAVAAVRDIVKITVAAETTRAYAQICSLGEQLAVARRSLEVVSREAEITGQRHQAGAGTEFDIVRSQLLVAQTRAAIPPLEGQQRAALFQLSALLGRAPADAPRESLTCGSAPRLADLIPVGDGAALLKRRPDIRQAERRLASATARIGVATADLYPNVTLKGLFGGVGSELDQLATNRGVTWGIGPTVTWIFPNQSLARARIRQAKSNAQAALDAFDGAVLQALKEVEQSLSVYSAELDRRRALSDAQDKAQRAFDMAHDQFVAGSLSTLELLVTEQSLIATNAALAAADAALVVDQIAIFKALGGGWQ